MQLNASRSGASRIYTWSAFALTFVLMLSDFASRSVLFAIIPMLKMQWTLTDTQLGSLVAVTSLIVGTMSLPISVLADRWGRARSVTVMAAVWGLATFACGLSGGLATLLVARAVIGLGEAGYASCGAAILMQIFPSRARSTIAGAFLAAAMFGSVLGVGVGGVLAAHLGWRGAFFVVGTFGVLPAVAYGIVVRELPAAAPRSNERMAMRSTMRLRSLAEELFAKRTAVCAYIGFGLQNFALFAVMAWLPSYLNRYYAMDSAVAGVMTAFLMLVSGLGMIVCGHIVDRLGRRALPNKMRVPAAYALLSSVLLAAAFFEPAGTAQLVLLGAGLFVAGGTAGPSLAVVADTIDPAIHAAALAMVALSGSLLGQALGPFATGILADGYDLRTALQVAPVVSLLAAAAFAWGSRFYEGDLQRSRTSAMGVIGAPA
jgi:MFS family permease